MEWLCQVETPVGVIELNIMSKILFESQSRVPFQVMSPNSHLDSGAEDLWIQIVLFDLSRPRRISDAGVVWHPSQALEGYVLITARGKIDIDEIYISFEGERLDLDEDGRTNDSQTCLC